MVVIDVIAAVSLALFGTAFLMIYKKFQTLVDNINKFGAETEGEVIYMSTERMGRGSVKRPVVEFEADGLIIRTTDFTVDYHASLEIGQKVIVRYNQYNTSEYLISTYDDPDLYLNNEHGFGERLGLAFGAVLWLAAIVRFIMFFV